MEESGLVGPTSDQVRQGAGMVVYITQLSSEDSASKMAGSDEVGLCHEDGLPLKSL